MDPGKGAQLYVPVEKREEQGDLPAEQQNDKNEQPARLSGKARNPPYRRDDTSMIGDPLSGGGRDGGLQDRDLDAGFGHA